MTLLFTIIQHDHRALLLVLLFRMFIPSRKSLLRTFANFMSAQDLCHEFLFLRNNCSRDRIELPLRKNYRNMANCGVKFVFRFMTTAIFQASSRQRSVFTDVLLSFQEHKLRRASFSFAKGLFIPSGLFCMILISTFYQKRASALQLYFPISRRVVLSINSEGKATNLNYDRHEDNLKNKVKNPVSSALVVQLHLSTHGGVQNCRQE